MNDFGNDMIEALYASDLTEKQIILLVSRLTILVAESTEYILFRSDFDCDLTHEEAEQYLEDRIRMELSDVVPENVLNIIFEYSTRLNNGEDFSCEQDLESEQNVEEQVNIDNVISFPKRT
jgi:hypothetical protein